MCCRSRAARMTADGNPSRWFLRADRCYLIPGDSPIGYRLPLDSQPWTAKGDYPFIHAPDPSRSFPSLLPHAEIRRQFRDREASNAPADGQGAMPPSARDAAATPSAQEAAVVTPSGWDAAAAPNGASAGEHQAAPADVSADAAERAPLPKESAVGITRTSMCAEPRNGILYIFMPPTRELEHYLELVAAVEAAAEALAQPVMLEGYEPPNDPRISNFRVTRTRASSRSTFIPPRIGSSSRIGLPFCTRLRASRV